jgi:anti-sigma regulatory factor (Ser/Thr protein kinase)
MCNKTRDMDVSGFNKLKALSYNWCFINDSDNYKFDSIETENLVAVVPQLEIISKFCYHGISFRGIIKRDFIKDLNDIVGEEAFYIRKFKFDINDYSKGIEKIRSYVDEDSWKKMHLFTDEAVSNIILHSGKNEGSIEAYFLKNNAVIISVTDHGGRLVSRSLRKALCSLCISYKEGKEFNSENIIIGGNGLKLLFHYVTFIKFNVIPFELTQIMGVFMPKVDFSGYIFEDRREEIFNDCLFRKI